MKYQYLLFDFDDTLLDFTKTEHDAFYKAMERAGLKSEEGYLELYSKINHAKWMQLNEGLITKDDIFKTRFRDFFREVGIDYDAENFNQTYLAALGEPVHYIDGVVEVLRELAKEAKLYVVTNGVTSVQESRMSRCEFKDCITQVFISQKIGHEKPKTEYFEAVFGQIPGFQKEKALIIGDSLTSDIRGGNNAGIATCWFNPNQKEHNGIDHVDYEIRTLAELVTLLA